MKCAGLRPDRSDKPRRAGASQMAAYPEPGGIRWRSPGLAIAEEGLSLGGEAVFLEAAVGLVWDGALDETVTQRRKEIEFLEVVSSAKL